MVWYGEAELWITSRPAFLEALEGDKNTELYSEVEDISLAETTFVIQAKENCILWVWTQEQPVRLQHSASKLQIDFTSVSHTAQDHKCRLFGHVRIHGVKELTPNFTDISIDAYMMSQADEHLLGRFEGLTKVTYVFLGGLSGAVDPGAWDPEHDLQDKSGWYTHHFRYFVRVI